MAHLTLVLQGRDVRKFVLNPTRTTIGRGQDNDIVINNLALSRKHAEILCRDGVYEVRDAQSQNGVYVNNERVHSTRVLKDTDTITLGTYSFVFSHEVESAKLGPTRTLARPRDEIDDAEETRDADADDDVVQRIPLLVLKYNDVELQRFPLSSERCVVGRGQDCDVQIAERRLSRRHCEIVREAGRHLVKDLGSQNGTYVNRRRIAGACELQHGDVLNFAEYSLQFLRDASAYDGPDAAPSEGARSASSPSLEAENHRIESDIYREKTEFPEAYVQPPSMGLAPSIVPGHTPVRPSEAVEDPDLEVQPAPPFAVSPLAATTTRQTAEPLVEAPSRSRERRVYGAPKGASEAAVVVRPIRPAVPPPTRKVIPRPPTEPEEESLDASLHNVRVAPTAARVGAAPVSMPSASASASASTSASASRQGSGSSSSSAFESRPARPNPPRRPVIEHPVVGSLPPHSPKHRKGRPVAAEAPARPAPDESADVDDERGDVRPEESLAGWYSLRREDSSLEGEDPAGFLDRGNSSVSHVLSTMMVDKRDLDRNLKVRAKQRRFSVEVFGPGRQRIYSGPLDNPVTILGTDPGSDIQLVGRFVAGRHSLLVRVLESLLLVRLGSSSAARVNGLPKLQAFLKNGDVIQIDETTLHIRED